MQFKIIELRKKKGMHQQAMADLLDIHLYTYGKKERGQVAFTAEELFKIAQHFGLTLDEVYSKIESIKNAKEESE